MRSQKHSTGQETPGHHGPAAGDANPLFSRIAHDQRAQGKSKGHGETHVSQIQHGRMNHHLGILQQRVQARSIRRQLALHERKRMGGEVQQQQKENLHRRNNRGSVCKEPCVRLVAEPQNQSVGRQQQRPEKQRALLPRPQRGELVRRGQIAIAVVKNVSDGEVILKGGNDQDQGREKDHCKGGNPRAARGFAQAFRARAGTGQCQHSRQE